MKTKTSGIKSASKKKKNSRRRIPKKRLSKARKFRKTKTIQSASKASMRFHRLITRPVREQVQNCVEPSTSQQVANATRTIDSGALSPTTRQRKPFVKFKDNESKKSRHKKNNHFKPNAKKTSPNQLACRKILRVVRKRRTSLSRTRSISDSMKCAATPNLPITTSQSSPAAKSFAKPEEGEISDDDCVCLEPQPEVIVIDDDTLTSNRLNKPPHTSTTPYLKDYVPLGARRFRNVKTSTPKRSIYNKARDRTYHLYEVPPCKSSSLLFNQSLETWVCATTTGSKTDEDNDVVLISDSMDASAVKSESLQKTVDESVIFVKEKPPNTKRMPQPLDFIPLETPRNEILNQINFKIDSNPSKTIEPKRPRNDLFTSIEQKEIRKYNSNTYNPNKDDPAPLSKKRMVIVDGSNVAYNHALNKIFSVKGLKICLDYFEKMGHEVKAVVPQFRLQKQKSSDPECLEKLHGEGKIVFTPCKVLPGKSTASYDDRFVLQLAAEFDAAVVSNDNYRDLIHENLAFKKIIENRVIGYTWCNDMFILPKDPYGKWGPTLDTILNRS